jgi:uncharacterized protein YbjT (DUF2867 family)
MVVFVTGATGFIGRALSCRLIARGHDVVAAARHVTVDPAAPLCGRFQQVDFVRDVRVEDWRPRLAGVDAVVNTVGIFRESDHRTFERIHREAPQALFAACKAEGISRVVQLSALGADERAVTPYHRSKRDADDALLALIPTAVSAQPSLVYGAGGTSARLFTTLASLPLVPLPGDGEQRVQPIHIEDLVDALCRLVEEGSPGHPRVALVGPRAVSLRAFLVALRHGMALPASPFIRIPAVLMRGVAAMGSLARGSLLDRDALSMLERGNVADAADTTRLIGRLPRSIEAFIEPREAPHVRTEARLRWLLPLLRATIAFVWIFTGVVSLGIYPVEESYRLLARVGAPAAWGPALLYGAAALDIALGVLVFAVSGRPRRWLWRAQAALILGYTAIITWRLPEFWLHPYGPVLKNVPLLAALWLLDVLEEDG